jgi:hypothetical protein
MIENGSNQDDHTKSGKGGPGSVIDREKAVSTDYAVSDLRNFLARRTTEDFECPPR